MYGPPFCVDSTCLYVSVCQIVWSPLVTVSSYITGWQNLSTHVSAHVLNRADRPHTVSLSSTSPLSLPTSVCFTSQPTYLELSSVSATLRSDPLRHDEFWPRVASECGIFSMLVFQTFPDTFPHIFIIRTNVLFLGRIKMQICCLIGFRIPDIHKTIKPDLSPVFLKVEQSSVKVSCSFHSRSSFDLLLWPWRSKMWQTALKALIDRF